MWCWRSFLFGAACVLAISASGPSAASETKKVGGGKTQVVAKLDGREITISDLRGEMGRLGLSPGDVNAERIALESVINRILLADAARAANVHRQPEAIRRMAAAEEQALADFYIATASQPPEPTLSEIEDFIIENRDLFAERKLYTFTVLTMQTEAFDQEKLTPLFDDSADFSDLSAALQKAGAAFAQAPMKRPSNAFPAPIRKQLAEYGVRDNIVLKGDVETQIMKITAIEAAPTPSSDAPALARQALLQQSARARAERLLAALKTKSSLSYYRATAAPAPADEDK